MKALAEIQVVPLGVGTSVRREVKRAQTLIRESGLEVEPHAHGTNVEGDLHEILQLVERLHETLHGDGAPRLSTLVKLSTRTDKEESMASREAGMG